VRPYENIENYTGDTTLDKIIPKNCPKAGVVIRGTRPMNRAGAKISGIPFKIGGLPLKLMVMGS
jgi:hypothetical protein